jgi:cytidylate kinase
VAVNVVCISRSFGAGGEEIGRLVAARLRFRLLDEEIVARAAAREGLDAKDVASAEQRKGWLVRFIEGAAGGPDPEMTGFGVFGSVGAGGTGSSEEYRELIKEAIRETAEQGAAVIVAHAASYALAERDDVLRILVTASPPTRSRRIAETLDLDEQTATKRIKESDAARADYLKRFYGVDSELPTQYDLVINTDTLTVEDAAAIVAHAAGG